MHDRTKGILLVLGAALFWSPGGLLLKLADGSPATVASYRSGFAALTLLAIAVFRKTRPSGGWRLVCFGLALAGTMFCFVIGNKLTTAAAAINLQYLAPLWVLIIGAIFLKEKPTLWHLPAFILCAIGALFFFWGDLSPREMTGNLMALLAGVFFGVAMVLMRSLRQCSAVYIAGMGNLIAFPVMLIGAIFWAETSFAAADLGHLKLSLTDMGLCALMGVLQTALPYLLYSMGIRHLKAYVGSLLCLVEPILNPLWVFIFQREPFSIFMFIGIALILGGLVFIILPNRKRVVPPPPD